MSDSKQTWNARLALAGTALLILVVGFGLGRCGQSGDSRGRPHGDTAKASDEVKSWTCSMHPQVDQPGPGSCPICGMDLIPRTESSSPTRVSLSPRAALLSKIETEAVRAADGTQQERRLLGRVDYDETSLRTATAWVAGRVDRLHVASTGQRIRVGQKVATLYSPEIYSAHADLLQALKQKERLAGSDASLRASEAAVNAARKRLQLLGISDGELRTMESAKSPWRQVPIRANVGGTVIERLIDQGAYVQAGAGLYRVAQLGKVWVQLDAYESDLPQLSVGQVVTLSVEALPGQSFTGEVAFIDPVVDTRTRTTRVRVVVSNKDSLLRPGMFAEARVSAGGHSAHSLSIPDTAPLFTGRRSVVFVALPDTAEPTYELVEVSLGAKVGNRYPVLSGLTKGQRVVTRGAFVLDADLQLRGGYSMMSRPDDHERANSGALKGISDEERAALAPMTKVYLEVGQSLAADDLSAAKAQMAHLAKSVEVARSGLSKQEHRDAFERVAKGLVEHSRAFSSASKLRGARLAFEEISAGFMEVFERFGNPLEHPVRLAQLAGFLGHQLILQVALDLPLHLVGQLRSDHCSTARFFVSGNRCLFAVG